MRIIKLLMKNKKIRLAAALSAAVWVAAAAQIVVTEAFSEKTNITEAFATSDNIRISGCTVDITAQMDSKKADFKEESKGIIESLELYSGTEAQYADCDNANQTASEECEAVKAKIETDEYDMYATAAWSEQLGHTYFHCRTDIKKNAGISSSIKRGIENVLKQAGAKYVTYIRLDAYLEGRADAREYDKCTAQIFERLGAVPVAAGHGSIYTQYGYSERLETVSVAGGHNKKDVNVQVSICYDEVLDITKICVGSPILNTAY